MKAPNCSIPLAGTPFVVLPHDNEMTVRANKLQTIKIDTEFDGIPELEELKPGDIVVDVGAFIGGTVVRWLDKGCIVHAFEPYPDSFECLKYNTQGRQCFCYNVALGAGDKVTLNDLSVGGNLGGRPVTISPDGDITRRLDDYFFPSLKLLKIDVEGMEFCVLEGARKTIETHRPIILIEANDISLGHHGKTKADLKSLLESFGYDVRVATWTEERFLCDYLCTFKV